MGPTIMGLSWQKTIHSAAQDPNSGESGLENTLTGTPFYGTPSQAFNTSVGHTGVIAVGTFKDASNKDVLMIMNKDIILNAGNWVYTSNTTTYTVNGNVYPRSFDKDNGGWKMVTRIYDKPTNTTRFTLTIAAGDMELVRLGPPDITPILNLLLGD